MSAVDAEEVNRLGYVLSDTKLREWYCLYNNQLKTEPSELQHCAAIGLPIGDVVVDG